MAADKTRATLLTELLVSLAEIAQEDTLSASTEIVLEGRDTPLLVTISIGATTREDLGEPFSDGTRFTDGTGLLPRSQDQ